MSRPTESSSQQTPRRERVRQVIDHCIARRATGEEVTDESLTEAHPDLMPELADALKNLRLVQQAQQQAVQTASTQLHIRCPHCHNPIEVVEESSLSDVVCPSCGSHFSLVDDATQTFHASSHDMVNHFQLLDKLGVGAFGTVWSARDTQLDRVVALKIPRKGQLSSEDTEKFIREARAAAQLHHPNIVSVLEVGRHEDRVYMACDYVQGLDLADWLSHGQPTVKEAAELCATLADALQHAHDHGVIHRDLKPSNVILDTDGQPHLMDFGLAKREAAEMTVTVDGKLLGTPAYMSPEQARGAAHDADARSDVYSLGVILFELVTGHRPFRGSTRILLHQVLTEDAPSPRKLNPGVPRDLETICLKCLEKSPENRYQTAGELSEDLSRFLQGKPVVARPITGITRAWRLAKRHPAAAAVVALLTVLAVAGPLWAITLWSFASSEAAARVAAEHANREAQRLLYTSDMGMAQKSVQEARLGHAIELLDRHQPRPGEEDLRGFEWFYLWGTCQRSIMSPSIPQAGVLNLLYSPDGNTLVAADTQGKVKRWNTNTTDLIEEYDINLKDISSGTGWRFSPDGTSFAVGLLNGGVRLCQFSIAQEYTLTKSEPAAPTQSTAFSPNGSWLATGAGDGHVALWNLQARQLAWEAKAHDDRVYSVAFSPDGKTVASGGRDEKVKLWNISTGDCTEVLDVAPYCNKQSPVHSVEFSHDGRFLAIGTSGDNALMLWDTKDTQVVRRLGASSAFITTLAFSPNDEALAAAGSRIQLWNTNDGHLLDSLRCPVHGSTASMEFSPDGMTIAAAYVGATSGVKLWETHAPPNPRVLHHLDNIRGGAITADGRTFVTAGDKALTVWDSATGQKIHETPTHGQTVWKVACSRDGRYIAAAGSTTFVDIWDSTTGHLAHRIPHDVRVYLVAFSPDRDLLATGTSDGDLFLYSVDGWRLLDKVHSHDATYPILTLTFSPDGKLLVHSGRDDLPEGATWTTKLWDLETFELVQSIEQVVVCSADFSSDSSLLACGLYNGEVLLWDVATQRELRRIRGLDSTVASLAFTPDDETLMTGGRRTVRFWNVSTGELRFELDAHDDAVTFLAMPKEGVLITGSNDDTAKIWTAATQAEVGQMRQQWRQVLDDQ